MRIILRITHYALRAMRITNATRQTTLAKNARRADGFFARGRGLMFTSHLPEGGGLILDPCNAIVMFFMSYPLDIVFLDKEGKVVFMYKGIKPWRMGRI